MSADTRDESQARIETNTSRVACNGGGGALGHPNVYLEMDPKVGEVTCPYCSRVFVLKKS